MSGTLTIPPAVLVSVLTSTVVPGIGLPLASTGVRYNCMVAPAGTGLAVVPTSRIRGCGTNTDLIVASKPVPRLANVDPVLTMKSSVLPAARFKVKEKFTTCPKVLIVVGPSSTVPPFSKISTGWLLSPVSMP